MDQLQVLLEAVNRYSPAITALTTVAVAVLTYLLASDNRRLRKAGTEPEVVAYLAPHPDGHGGVNFVLANVGRGPAFKIKFELVYNEEDFQKHDVLLLNDHRRTALAVLPQGERIGSLFGVGYVLFGNHSSGDRRPLQPFRIRISYLDIRGARHRSEQEIDITQFAGLAGLLAKPPERDIADHLAKIEKHIGKLAVEGGQFSAALDATDLATKYRHKLKAGETK